MSSLISIITPCYNSAPFISRAIESVQSQTLQNWEMLIVDDCSSDNSATIIHQYAEKDNRIHYFKTEKPSGSPVTPRNIGIENAQGRFIAFLDSDDCWLPTKLEEQVAVLQYQNIAVVFSNYEKVDENGLRNNRVIAGPFVIDYKQLLKGNVIGNLTGMYDTQKVGKIYMQKVHHEDYVLWLSILKKGFLALNTNTVSALYTIRKGSVSANKLEVFRWTWFIYRKIEKLSWLKSTYYFLFYLWKAFAKYKK